MALCLQSFGCTSRPGAANIRDLTVLPAVIFSFCSQCYKKSFFGYGRYVRRSVPSHSSDEVFHFDSSLR